MGQTREWEAVMIMIMLILASQSPIKTPFQTMPSFAMDAPGIFQRFCCNSAPQLGAALVYPLMV